MLKLMTMIATWVLLINHTALAAEPASDTAPALGYGKLGYALPEVGSYQLPALNNAGDGKVLDDAGNKKTLHGLYKGKYSLLGFIYTHCTDVNGCPLTSYVFYKLKVAMREDAELEKHLRLLSLSFDPERDKPMAMRMLTDHFRYAGKQGEWKFLTTDSLATLQPILNDYGQDVQREMTVNGDETGDISHSLKVYLIDPEFKIRNIYSVSFLHPEIIINDLKTLLLQDKAAAKFVENTDAATKQGVDGKNITSLAIDAVSHNTVSAATANDANTRDTTGDNTASLSIAGDVKEGYDKQSYITASKSVLSRQGKAADLLAMAKQKHVGLPTLEAEQSQALTADKIALGRKLFFDRRLSLNDTFSCAMCHIPEQGFSSNEMAMAVGIEGRSVRRNTPSLYNSAYAQRLFHDGREDSLEQQVWSPLLAHNEMANPSIGYVMNKLRAMPDYKGLFEKAFNGESVTMLNLGQAIASYERSLVSANSAFDRWHYAKQEDALSGAAKRGFALFTGKGACVSCHSINSEYALFTDNQLHNTGIGYKESMGIKPAKQRMALAPGVFVEVDSAIIASVSEAAPADLGLYEVTQNPHDRWKYKTPSLRNVSLTAPYMHNGSLSTLTDVVQFYNQGGVANELLDARIKPLGLNDTEVADMVAFLHSLVGDSVNTLVADAFAAPVGDVIKD